MLATCIHQIALMGNCDNDKVFVTHVIVLLYILLLVILHILCFVISSLLHYQIQGLQESSGVGPATVQ